MACPARGLEACRRLQRESRPGARKNGDSIAGAVEIHSKSNCKPSGRSWWSGRWGHGRRRRWPLENQKVRAQLSVGVCVRFHFDVSGSEEQAPVLDGFRLPGWVEEQPADIGVDLLRYVRRGHGVDAEAEGTQQNVADRAEVTARDAGDGVHPDIGEIALESPDWAGGVHTGGEYGG